MVRDTLWLDESYEYPTFALELLTKETVSPVTVRVDLEEIGDVFNTTSDRPCRDIMCCTELDQRDIAACRHVFFLRETA